MVQKLHLRKCVEKPLVKRVTKEERLELLPDVEVECRYRESMVVTIYEVSYSQKCTYVDLLIRYYSSINLFYVDVFDKDP